MTSHYPVIQGLDMVRLDEDELFYDHTKTTSAVRNNEVSCTEDRVLLLSQLRRNACRYFYDRRGRDNEAG